MINLISVNASTVRFGGADEMREFGSFLSYVLEKQIFGSKWKFNLITRLNSFVLEDAGLPFKCQESSHGREAAPGLPVPEPSPEWQVPNKIKTLQSAPALYSSA